MENLLSYIGSIASVGSIPLAIYLFLKSKEDKIDKVRRQILKIISYQIGENRLLSEFEINKIINSNIRNNKLDRHSLSMENILEDLVSDTVSSPLLNTDRKDEILKNLKELFPSKTNIHNMSNQDRSYSTTFAISILFISILPMVTILLLGEDGWNSKIEWWFNFNMIEGFIPNLLFSLIMAGLGLLISVGFIKSKESHNKNEETNTNPKAD